MIDELNPPGVMLWLDMAEPLSILTDAERGKLLNMIFAYARGREPRFQPGQEQMRACFAFIRAKMDRDIYKYRERAIIGTYQQDKRWLKKNKGEAITFEEWCERQNKYTPRLLLDMGYLDCDTYDE